MRYKFLLYQPQIYFDRYFEHCRSVNQVKEQKVTAKVGNCGFDAFSRNHNYILIVRLKVVFSRSACDRYCLELKAGLIKPCNLNAITTVIFS